MASFLAVWLVRTGSEVIGRGMEPRRPSGGHQCSLAALQEGVRDHPNSGAQYLSMARWDTRMHRWAEPKKQARRGGHGRSDASLGTTGTKGSLAWMNGTLA